TVLGEKQQVQLLAASVVEILARVGKETGQGPPEEQMDLEEPVVPEWRAGRLSIGYHEERDLLLLEAEEVLDGDEEDDEEDQEATGGGQPRPDVIDVAPGVEDLAPDAASGGSYEGNGEANEVEEDVELEEMEDLESLTGEAAMATEPQRVRFW